MDERQELMMLRRLAELEAKAKRAAAAQTPALNPAEGGSTLKVGPFDTGIQLGEAATNTFAGVASGFAGVGDTIINAVGNLAEGNLPSAEQFRLPGAPAEQYSNAERSASLRQFNDDHKDSTAFTVGQIGGNILATAPVGGVLGAGVKALAPGATGLANALTTGGMRAGATPGVGNMLTRIAGGAGTGAAAAGLINPDDIGAGALIGGAMPAVVAGAGKLGHAIGRNLPAAEVPSSLRESVQAARQAGYVIPPSQAKPTAVNRLLEGFSGKITTAQNASAKNQPITNELVKRAIGAEELSPAALAKIRSSANAAYDELGRFGAFQVDDAFRESLGKAGAISAQMRRDFPELVNAEVDQLVEGLSSRGQFDAQSAIEAIKQFRYSGSANKAAQDPAKKALGSAQMKIAGALEDLIDRNLQATGDQGLLANYRSARQTLAKVYDVERALNTASGNVDAKKLGDLLKKGRPLTGELRQVAEFASQFPKAVQMTERMGSLPQVSPLDFGALGAMSAATSNPLLMAGVLARPAARSLVLSNAVQNRLATPAGTSGNRLLELLGNPAAAQLAYRSAPAIAVDR
jgi:hypothetical protein